jgi:hypothetical protein
LDVGLLTNYEELYPGSIGSGAAPTTMIVHDLACMAKLR